MKKSLFALFTLITAGVMALLVADMMRVAEAGPNPVPPTAVQQASLLGASTSNIDLDLAHVYAAKAAGTLDPNDPAYVRVLQSAASNFEGRGGHSLDQGNDACPATVIAALPYSDTGTTVGRVNDYTTCYPANSAPDVIYQYTPGSNQAVTVSLCGSSYDTAVEIRHGGACPGTTSDACNDDFCGVQSQVTVALTSGVTYYIIVDGFGSSSGNYILNVSASQPCSITCQPGDVLEYLERHDSTNAYWDSNGGCNDPIPSFQVLQCGDSVCGIGFTYIGPGGLQYRDTDWYRIPVPCAMSVSWTVTAEFAFASYILDVTDCANIQVLASGQNGPCTPLTLSATNLAAGGLYAVAVAPQAFTGVPAQHYRGWLSCSPPCADPARPNSLIIVRMAAPQELSGYVPKVSVLTCAAGSGGSVPAGFNLYEQENGGTGNHPSRYIGTESWAPQMGNPTWATATGSTTAEPFLNNRYHVQAVTHLPRPDVVVIFDPAIAFDTLRWVWNGSDSLIIGPVLIPTCPPPPCPPPVGVPCCKYYIYAWVAGHWDYECVPCDAFRTTGPNDANHSLTGIYGIAVGDTVRLERFANVGDSLVLEASRTIIVLPQSEALRNIRGEREPR